MSRIQPEYLPTRKCIAQQCAAIQRRWTEAERQRRLVGGLGPQTMPWRPPHIRSSELLARVQRAVIDHSA